MKCEAVDPQRAAAMLLPGIDVHLAEDTHTQGSAYALVGSDAKKGNDDPYRVAEHAPSYTSRLGLMVVNVAEAG